MLGRQKKFRKIEAAIRASGIFDEHFYRGQLRIYERYVKNPIRHYLIFGEKRRLSPAPLFDTEWYAATNPDVLASTEHLLYHFIQHGELELRSPHPLFDSVYYSTQAGPQIARPLHHFLTNKSRPFYNTHPLFETNKFLDRYTEIDPIAQNPLAAFLSDKKYESLILDVFQGEYYAKELREVYNWPRHSISEFLKRPKDDIVSPHPDFDPSLYLRANFPHSITKINAFLNFVYAREQGSLGASDKNYPIQGKKNTREFTGDYTLSQASDYPIDITSPKPAIEIPSTVARSTVAARLDDIRIHFNRRLRLDHVAPKANKLSNSPTISILMPVYRPPIIFVDRAIRSVIQQSFSNWELCIVDDASNDAELRNLLCSYAARDERIKVALAHQNGGISRASNAALNLASGDYIGLLDHDDMLTVDAIKLVTQALNFNKEIDFIYSDEALIDEDDSAVRFFSKPDWSPTLLLACMYTGHFTIYRRTLVQSLGGFRSEYDFSQDYDLALRVSEITSNVHHLQAYVYGWRMIEGSAAHGGKDFARFTNVAALQDAVERRSYPGTGLGFSATNAVVRSAKAEQPKISIVIPSDDFNNICISVQSIIEKTIYSKLEIIVVTNSRLIKQLRSHKIYKSTKFVAYDEKFNFSHKCNLGARAAEGEYIVFYNDDVRVTSSNWINSLLDVACLDNVGAVAPKLIYENGLIQHAGMITAVRRLVGTAFHMLPAETSDHFGMAQFTREVTLLCGACLMVKSNIFNKLNGFDVNNFPINHSDVDLCFRLQELGFSCVYVATTNLRHIGHVSIGKEEKKDNSHRTGKDKADIYLLRRWAEQLSYDSYFPPPMRDILYFDSQELFNLHPGPGKKSHRRKSFTGNDILIVSHDLTNSGAPKIVLDLATIFQASGHYVCVISPIDGPMRNRLNAIGIDVIIDELVLKNNSNMFDFFQNFDFAIANTVVSWQFVHQMARHLKIFWYIHESALIDHYVNSHANFLPAFQAVAGVWVGSEKSKRHLSYYGIDVSEIVPYGVDDSVSSSEHQLVVRPVAAAGPMIVGLFGSFEPRKGQDLAILGMMNLSLSERYGVELRLFGRVLDENFFQAIQAIAGSEPSIVFGGELSPERYALEMSRVDVVIVPSRDDTLPLVSIDALRLNKVLVLSRTTGTSDWLNHDHSAFILEENSPTEIAMLFNRLKAERNRWQIVSALGNECFYLHFSWSRFVERVHSLIENNHSR